MATTWFTKGLHDMSLGNRWDTAALKVMLLEAGYTFDKDHDFVADVVASEAAGTGYTGGFGGAGRKALSSPTIAIDLTNDLIKLDCADLTWAGLNLGTLDKWIIFRELTDDASSPLWCCGDPSDLVTNGSGVILTFHVDGVLKLQN
jgi:hypothetical protein